MPAPAVYVLAVVGTIGAAFAFKHFVYEPHLAPKFEQWAEEFIARRRARRMQRQGPIPVPASIPLLRRRGRRSDSDSTLSDSDDDSNKNEPSHSGRRGISDTSGSRTRRNGFGAEFDSNNVHEVTEWRSAVERSQTASTLRHRTNHSVHPMDQSINPIPHPTMSPTHVISDTSAPTTPTTTTIPSRLSSPPPEVSPITTTQTFSSGSTVRPSVHGRAVLSGPSPLSQVHTLPATSPPQAISSHLTPTSPTRASNPIPDYSPPSFSSPIPSLSQSYPQELDRERGVELLSPPSSGTSSPFTTFSPLVAPQALSPFAVVQPLDRDPSPEIDTWSSNPASRALSPSQQTITSTTASHYQSLPASPTSSRSNLSSPVNVTREPLRSPSPHELSYLSSPSPVNFASPNALSPRSPHSDLSDLEFVTDIDAISDPGSDGSVGSDRSWTGIAPTPGSVSRR